MNRADSRSILDERAWERRLFPVLLVAFAFASVTTLATATVYRMPAAPQLAKRLLAAGTADRTRPPAGSGLVPVTVADVVVADGETASVALLMDPSKEWVLPVFMNASDARVIENGLRMAPDDRAQTTTAELLDRTIDRLGGKVVRVEVEALGANAARSRIVIERDGHELAVDASPEEALEVAVSTGAPVYASSGVLDRQGIKREQVLHGPSGLPATYPDPERL